MAGLTSLAIEPVCKSLYVALADVLKRMPCLHNLLRMHYRPMTLTILVVTSPNVDSDAVWFCPGSGSQSWVDLCH